MTNEEMKKKIDELMSNEDFAKKVAGCETYDELAGIFSAEGLTVSAGELEAAIEKISAKGADGEFSEDDLEQVSGGIFISGGAFLAWSIGYAVVTIGSAISYAKSKKKSKK